MNNINVDISVLPHVASDLKGVVDSLHGLIDDSGKLLSTIKQIWDDAQFEAFAKEIRDRNSNMEKLCPEISRVATSIEEYHTNLHNAINNFYR